MAAGTRELFMMLVAVTRTNRRHYRLFTVTDNKLHDVTASVCNTLGQQVGQRNYWESPSTVRANDRDQLTWSLQATNWGLTPFRVTVI